MMHFLRSFRCFLKTSQTFFFHKRRESIAGSRKNCLFVSPFSCHQWDPSRTFVRFCFVAGKRYPVRSREAVQFCLRFESHVHLRWPVSCLPVIAGLQQLRFLVGEAWNAVLQVIIRRYINHLTDVCEQIVARRDWDSRGYNDFSWFWKWRILF